MIKFDKEQKEEKIKFKHDGKVIILYTNMNLTKNRNSKKKITKFMSTYIPDVVPP